MTSILDRLLQATEDTRGQDAPLIEDFPLVGMTPDDATDLANDMIVRGYLPSPSSIPVVTGMDAIQLTMMGVVIGLRAAQLTQVDELENIEIL